MPFPEWLIERLNKAGIDGEVYGEYIGGTLDTMRTSSAEDLEEALLEILESYMDDGQQCKTLCEEILSAWGEQREEERNVCEEVSSTLQTSLIPKDNSQKPQDGHVCEQDSGALGGGMTSEEKMRLISQYDCESDEEMEEFHSKEKAEPGLFLNRNAAVVSEAGRLHREQLKTEHDSRMERIKLDKENRSRRHKIEKKRRKREHKSKSEDDSSYFLSFFIP